MVCPSGFQQLGRTEMQEERERTQPWFELEVWIREPKSPAESNGESWRKRMNKETEEKELEGVRRDNMHRVIPGKERKGGSQGTT